MVRRAPCRHRSRSARLPAAKIRRDTEAGGEGLSHEHSPAFDPRHLDLARRLRRHPIPASVRTMEQRGARPRLGIRRRNLDRDEVGGKRLGAAVCDRKPSVAGERHWNPALEDAAHVHGAERVARRSGQVAEAEEVSERHAHAGFAIEVELDPEVAHRAPRFGWIDAQGKPAHDARRCVRALDARARLDRRSACRRSSRG